MACSNNTPIHSPDRQSIIGIKRRSRASASDTLLATAAAMLKVLGISSSTRRNRNKGSKSKVGPLYTHNSHTHREYRTFFDINAFSEFLNFSFHSS